MNPNKSQRDRKKDITIKDLFPNFTPEQLVEAEEALMTHLKILIRIYERIVAEKEEKQFRYKKLNPPEVFRHGG